MLILLSSGQRKTKYAIYEKNIWKFKHNYQYKVGGLIILFIMKMLKNSDLLCVIFQLKIIYIYMIGNSHKKSVEELFKLIVEKKKTVSSY
jgi:hypothetical protein